MEEIWEDIKGYEGYYQVSNLGNVKSLSRITKGKKYGVHKLKDKILKPIKCGNYYFITLWKSRKYKQIYIHRLVATTFIPNPDSLPEVNHKDGNTENNNINNLEWCTRAYNIKHSYDVLKRKANVEGFKDYREKHKRKINQYDLKGNFIKKWNSISEAEKSLNITSIGTISQCCQHKNGRKTAFGYKWEYVENTTIAE